jgi:hypothetical protein
MSSIIFNTSHPSHPTIEGGLYSPWFDKPVIELIIFNTSQPSHPTIEEGLYSPWFDEPVIELIIFNNQGLYKPPSMVEWLGCEVLKIMSSITGSSNQRLYKPPSMVGWLGCEVTIEGGLYSPWFDEPVIELIIFNTSQPSQWLGCEVLKIMSSITGSSNQGLYKSPSMLGWLGCEVLKIMSSITGS